jgi:hypothetical protein
MEAVDNFESYYHYEGDLYVITIDSDWTVAKLRQKIFENLKHLGCNELNGTEYELRIGGESIPGKTKLKNIESHEYHYCKKVDNRNQKVRATVGDASESLKNLSLTSLHSLIRGGVQVVQSSFITWKQPLAFFENTSSLFIRNSYEILYNEIIQSPMPRHVVTGIPGIGKSQFCLYFAWRYLNDNPESSVMIEREYNNVHLISPDADTTILRSNCGTSCPYLIDMGSLQEPSTEIGSFGVVFSSPHPSRFKEWIKNTHLSSRYVMPIWSWQEIYTLNNNACIPIDGLELERRYDIAGGVPRLCLASTPDDFDAQVGNALQTKGKEIAERFFIAGHGMKPDDMSYVLIHLHPDVGDKSTKQDMRTTHLRRIIFGRNCIS